MKLRGASGKEIVCYSSVNTNMIMIIIMIMIIVNIMIIIILLLIHSNRTSNNLDTATNNDK